MAFPETADPALVVPAMADQATVDQATANPTTTHRAMDAADLSVEQAFFERALASSDRPVSFDSELPEPSRDLEARELRRVHFTRVVGAIIATLGIGALSALVQRGPEAASRVASYAVPQELPEMQVIEPAPSAPPPAPSVSGEPRSGVSATASAAAPRPRPRVAKPVVANAVNAD